MVVLFLPTMFVAQQKVIFRDISKEAGIEFEYTFGDYTYENILESSGSGITVFDYNNDGLMDLLMLNGKYLEGISDREGKVFTDSRNKLYRNRGDGTFEETGQQAGLDDLHWSMAAGAMDIDLDGFQDLYVLNYGPNVFYRNNGNGTFTNRTAETGLSGPESLNGFTKWSIGVAYLDHNDDGRIDAMVGNFLAFDPEYVSTQTPGMMPHPSEYKGQASFFYEQQPDGSFKDITAQLGLYYPDSKCMGLTVADVDSDGDLDIFQANDHQFNYLFLKEGNSYREAGVPSGVAANSQGQATGSMHGTFGDIDGDGLLDIFVSDLKYGALYRNKGNGLYEDITEQSGIAAKLAGKGGWGAALFDFDNDGDLDLITANGTAEELVLQYPLLLENDGTGKFKDVGHLHGAYFSEKRSGRGLVVWDYDNDGDQDVVISHVDLKANAAVLRNDGGNINNWLGITLLGESGLASGIGAEITVRTAANTQVLLNQWSGGYLSNNEPRVHIGLGQSQSIDELLIRWPDGVKESFEDLEVNRYLIIRKGKGIQ
jgi:hypothetical protein